MNRPKSSTIVRNKTDRSATVSKTQLNKQTSPVKCPRRSNSKVDQRSSSKTREHSNHKSSGTIYVCDRGTQWVEEDFEDAEGIKKLDSKESAKLLDLIKGLRSLQKDETSSKAIEQAIQLLKEAFSITVGKAHNKQSAEAFLLLQAQLQKLNEDMKTTSRKQKETNALFQKEKTILSTKLQEQELQLQKLKQSYQTLQEDKKKVEKLVKNQEKRISQLKEQLNEETQNKCIAEESVRLEKKKNLICSEYKDKLVKDLHLILKDFQSSATEQFAHIRKAYMSDEERKYMMLVNKKFACLSPSGLSSEESSPRDTVPWKDESETNVSEISHNLSGDQFKTRSQPKFDNNRYNNYEKEAIIEQDLISLPNEDQPDSEMSFFIRSNKPTNE